MPKSDWPIGVFDSGLGGISVLGEAMQALPGESFVYYGDSANAPYGTKETEEIRALTMAVANFLQTKEIKALLVACNTATSVAIKDLRRHFKIPVIGMEPALKPAVELNRPGKVIVLATPVTLGEEKFLELMARCSGQSEILPVSCPGLVEIIENPLSKPAAVAEYLQQLAEPLSGQAVGAVVLGCTHYVFVKAAVAAAFPGAAVIDGNQGTVKHLQCQLAAQGLLSRRPEGERTVACFTSGDPDKFLPLYQRFLAAYLK